MAPVAPWRYHDWIMSGFYDKLVTIFGDIKVFKHPLWIAYDPGSYRVRGPECRRISELLEPGDILLRHYDGYLDNAFITGVFSHAGLYLGEVTENDRAKIPETGVASRAFETGPCQVAHSTAEGVHLEDVLNFLRCDEVAVVRIPEILSILQAQPVPNPGRIHPKEQTLRDRLARNETVSRQEAVAVARDLALGGLGTEYDFAFDFKSGHRMSCTEFVLHCYRSVNSALGLVPRGESYFGGFVRKEVIRPDAYVASPFQLLHASESANRKLIRNRLQPV